MEAPEHSSHGRWGGRLTRRELPEHDPLLEALAAADRRRLANIWHHRAAMERRVADSFTVIRGSLMRSGASTELVELSTRAIDDEYRHAELSRLVASRFAGHRLPRPARLNLTVPVHRGASPALRDTLFVVGQCVFNETTASAFLETCLKHAEGALARAALQELLSDEIDHGRIGWAHLASLDESQRAALAPWLLPMAFLNLRQWRVESGYDPAHSEALTRHGSPASSVLHAALVDALSSLIVPGLLQLGLEIEPLKCWLDQGAPTDRPPSPASE